MIGINNNIVTNIFFYIVLPITIITSIIIILKVIKNKELTPIKKNMLILKTLGIVFTIYSIYTLIWSILELIPLKKYSILEESRLPIFLWIILPIWPFIITFFILNKYKSIKEKGDKNEQKFPSN